MKIGERVPGEVIRGGENMSHLYHVLAHWTSRRHHAIDRTVYFPVQIFVPRLHAAKTAAPRNR